MPIFEIVFANYIETAAKEAFGAFVATYFAGIRNASN